MLAVSVDVVRLLGSDSTVLGEMDAARTGRVGAALSRGRFPKSVSWVDPNEDAVLAAQRADRYLLAVADGHHGFDAALAAIQQIESTTSQVLSDDRDGRTVLGELFERAREQVAQALMPHEDIRGESRTALSVVLVRGREVWGATCGDSSIFLVRSGKARSLTSSTRFLGPRTPAPSIVRRRLRVGDALALVTDGFTDYLSQPVGTTLATAVTAADPAHAAQGLVRAAFAGGAGDNIGVVVLLPGERSRRRQKGSPSRR